MSKRIVFLDMEGTLLKKDIRFDDGLVAPSAWTVLAHALGDKCLQEENESKARWRAGAIPSYIEWMRQTVEIHKKFGLTKSIFDSVVNSADEMPGVAGAMERIHEMGYVTALITGGFKALADRLQRRLLITHALAGCEYFFDSCGVLQHANLLPADELGKVDFMRLMCREYSADPEKCFFIGDGMNDVHLARVVGCSVAFNGQPELRAVATRCIDQTVGAENFSAVADLIQALTIDGE